MRQSSKLDYFTKTLLFPTIQRVQKAKHFPAPWPQPGCGLWVTLLQLNHYKKCSPAFRMFGLHISFYVMTTLAFNALKKNLLLVPVYFLLLIQKTFCQLEILLNFAFLNEHFCDFETKSMKKENMKKLLTSSNRFLFLNDRN